MLLRRPTRTLAPSTCYISDSFDNANSANFAVLAYFNCRESNCGSDYIVLSPYSFMRMPSITLSKLDGARITDYLLQRRQWMMHNNSVPADSSFATPVLGTLIVSGPIDPADLAARKNARINGPQVKGPREPVAACDRDGSRSGSRSI